MKAQERMEFRNTWFSVLICDSTTLTLLLFPKIICILSWIFNTDNYMARNYIVLFLPFQFLFLSFFLVLLHWLWLQHKVNRTESGHHCLVHNFDGDISKVLPLILSLLWVFKDSLYIMPLSFLANNEFQMHSVAFPILLSSETFIQGSGPQPFWHQGLLSWKTIFPWTGGGGDGFGMIQVHYISCVPYFYCYYIVIYNNYTTHHNAESVGALSLFSCNQMVPSVGDGRQWHPKCVAYVQSTP